MASDENESVVDDDLTTFDFEDQDDLEFDDDDAPSGSDNGSADSSSSNESESNAESDNSDDSKDGGDKPAKRRRRRRRRSSNRDKGESNQPSGKKSQGRQQQKGGARGGQQQRKGKFARNAPPPPEAVTSGVIEGVLELHPKGYGFLRDKENDYGARETDAFVSSTFVEKHQLREGIMIRGEVGPGTRGQGPRLLNIESIDGGTVEEYEQIKHFETLTPINPFEQIKLEIGPEPITMRVMDLLTPIGKGQRALIVAPPRSGKTMLLQDIANSVSINHPEIHLIVLLIDERPEEVTELRRMVRGEVIASSMDRDVESHVRISQLIHERGKRLAEAGKDCFILMDSITRTARAFNKWVGNSGRTGTGGLDVKAMDIPRKMFGTAGGSTKGAR